MNDTTPADWQVTVTVPMALSAEQKDELFTVIADAVHDWEPDDRGGWDADVAGHPVEQQVGARRVNEFGELVDDCPHCEPTHGDPSRVSWGVFLDPLRDGDGQPTTLNVMKSDGAHVAESDADWLRSLIRTFGNQVAAEGAPSSIRVDEYARILAGSGAQHSPGWRAIAEQLAAVAAEHYRVEITERKEALRDMARKLDWALTLTDDIPASTVDGE